MMARIGRGEDYILTNADAWRIRTLQESGELLEDILVELSKYTKREQQELLEAFEDAGITAMNYDDKIYKAAGLSPVPLEQSPAMIRLMERNMLATMGEWKNFTRTTASVAQRLYIEQCDIAYNHVMTGAVGYSSFEATANVPTSFRILANNTTQSGRITFNSIALFEGDINFKEYELDKQTNTKKYFIYNLPDYLFKNTLDNHENRILELEKFKTHKYEKIIDLIGDSLTGGAYYAGIIYKYENHLKKLLPNWTMNNYGAGSEKANAISARSGGLEFYINPCTLTTTPTKVEFVDGQYRDFFLTTSTDFYNYYLDDGTKILLTRKTVGGSIVNYAALDSGTKTIKRPTRVYDDFILNDNTSHVAIICIGANGGINSEIDLVAQVKNIIHENGYTRYLVLPENMSDIGQKRDPLLRQNRYLNEEFGKHFVNTYDYMIRYGLSDFNITPTDADNTDISLSIIPESLRCDSIHPNEKGCEITANLLYQRGKELCYW